MDKMFVEKQDIKAEWKYQAYKCMQNGNEVFFYGSYDGRHCKYNIDSNKIHIIGEGIIVDDGAEPVEFYGSIDGMQITIFDSGKRCRWKDAKTGLEQSVCFNESACGFVNYSYVTVLGGTIHIFTRRTNEWFLIDIASKTVLKRSIIKDGAEEYIRGCILNGIVCLFSVDAKKCALCNLENGRAKLVDFISFGKNQVIWATTFDNKAYVMLLDGAVYSKSNEECDWKEEVRGHKYGSMGLLIVTKKYFVELPSQGENIVIINRSNNGLDVLSTYPRDFCYNNTNSFLKYSDYFYYDNRVYCPMRKANYLFSFGEYDGSIVWIKPQLPDAAEEGKFYAKRINNHLGNGLKMSLTDFIGEVKYAEL